MSLEERLLSFSLARDADDDDLRAAEPDAGAAAASLEEALPPSGIYRGGEDSAIAYERRADAIDGLCNSSRPPPTRDPAAHSSLAAFSHQRCAHMQSSSPRRTCATFIIFSALRRARRSPRL